MRLNFLTYGLGVSTLLLGGCQACTAAGGFDGITIATSTPKVDGAHTMRIDLDGDQARDRQHAEFMCDFEAVEDTGPGARAFNIRCDLVDVSKGLEKAAFFDSGYVAQNSDEAQYYVSIHNSRADELEVTVQATDGTALVGSMPMVEYGERYYPNGEECDDEGYRSANVEIDLELQ